MDHSATQPTARRVSAGVITQPNPIGAKLLMWTCILERRKI